MLKSRTTMLPGSRLRLDGLRPARFATVTAGMGLAIVLAAAMAAVALVPRAEVQSMAAPYDDGAGVGDRQVVLITGSTDGLGREVARRIAAGGAHVIVHGRNRERGLALVQEIEEDGRGSAAFYAADFASLDEVRRLGEAIIRDYDRLHILINNAGIWASGNDERQLSADGHELQFAVNYLSGYLLTRMLLPMLQKSAPARIINVASAAQAPIDFADVMMERGYTGSRGYAQSKLAQVMFTVDLARELEGSGVAVFALHPSTLMDTQMVRDAGVQPRTTIDQGARAVLQLVTAPDLQSGQYFNVTEPARANAQAYDDDALQRLRRLSDQLSRPR
jgi:NAD(P)-dependent dehydrogenase (short-subunit alcohol dehydrogenase family)